MLGAHVQTLYNKLLNSKGSAPEEMLTWPLENQTTKNSNYTIDQVSMEQAIAPLSTRFQQNNRTRDLIRSMQIRTRPTNMI
jgi:hypothetical protein